MSDPWDKHGGPAFPVDTEGCTYKGMTLRDYLAGQALTGMLAADRDGNGAWAAFAQDAYAAADAMLATREAKKAE